MGRRDLTPDLAVDQAGVADGRPAPRWKLGDPGFGAAVEPVGLGQQPRDEVGECRARPGIGQEGVGVEPGGPHPVERQVEPAHAGILADVAGDVRELHRGPEVAGPGQGLGCAHAHDQRHHRADGTGDPRGVVVKRVEIGIMPSLGIPGQTLDEGAGQRLRDGEVVDDLREGPVGGSVGGFTGIGPADPAIEAGHRGVTGRRARGLVDEIIRVAAERVETVGRLADIPG